MGYIRASNCILGSPVAQGKHFQMKFADSSHSWRHKVKQNTLAIEITTPGCFGKKPTDITVPNNSLHCSVIQKKPPCIVKYLCPLKLCSLIIVSLLLTNHNFSDGLGIKKNTCLNFAILSFSSLICPSTSIHYFLLMITDYLVNNFFLEGVG